MKIEVVDMRQNTLKEVTRDMDNHPGSLVVSSDKHSERENLIAAAECVAIRDDIDMTHIILISVSVHHQLRNNGRFACNIPEPSPSCVATRMVRNKAMAEPVNQTVEANQ